MDFRRECLSHSLSLLMSSFSLVITPPLPSQGGFTVNPSPPFNPFAGVITSSFLFGLSLRYLRPRVISPPHVAQTIVPNANALVFSPKIEKRHRVIHTTLCYHALCASEASAHGLSPVTSSPQDNLFRPVSCYAIFKGWLLLSQPPGCFGRPTCFPT